MTRSRDVSDSQDNLGGAVAPFVAGKNFLINGGFDFFQRGSLSTTTGGYGLDRWYQVSSGSGAAVTVTQQTTGVPLGSRYCARITTAAGSGYGNQYQWIETSNVAALWGKTVTLSIKLRRNAAFAGTLSVVLSKTATVDGGLGATWTSIGNATITNSQLPTGTTSTDWYTVAFAVAIPNDGTANGLQLSIQQSQVETSAYWEMAQAQLEIGAVATPFSRAGGSIGGELALCQRYYQRFTNLSAYERFGFGSAVSTSAVQITVPLKVTLRTTASAIDYAGITIYDGTTQSTAATSVVLDSASANFPEVTISGSIGVTTIYRPYWAIGNGTVNGSYLGFSAEL